MVKTIANVLFMIIFLPTFYYVFKNIWKHTRTISFSGLQGFVSSWMSQFLISAFIAGIPAIIVYNGFLSIFDSKPDKPNKPTYSQTQQLNTNSQNNQEDRSISQRTVISPGEPLSIEDLQCGGISIGDSSNDVLHKLGQPSSMEKVSGIDIYKFPAMAIRFSDDHKVSSILNNEGNNINTPRGIHIGSSLNDVIKTYGNNYEKMNPLMSTVGYTYYIELPSIELLTTKVARFLRSLLHGLCRLPIFRAQKPDSLILKGVANTPLHCHLSASAYFFTFTQFYTLYRLSVGLPTIFSHRLSHLLLYPSRFTQSGNYCF